MRSRYLILIIFLIGIFLPNLGDPMISDSTNDSPILIWIIDEPESDYLENLINNYQISTGSEIIVVRKDENSFLNELLLSFALGTNPDVMQLRSEWIPSLTEKNTLLNLEDTLENVEEYLPNVLRGVRAHDSTGDIGIFAIPHSADTTVFYYDETIYSTLELEMPEFFESWNWDQFSRSIITSSNRSDPENIKFGLGITELPNSIEPFFYGAGVFLFDNFTIDRKHYSFENDLTRDVLTFVYDLFLERKIAPEIDPNNLFINISINGMLNDDKIHAIFGNKGILSSILDADSNKEIKIAQIPKLSSKSSGTPLEITGFGISSLSDNSKIDESLKIINHLTADEYSIDAAKKYIYLPVKTDLFNHEDLNSNNYIQAFKFAFGNSYQHPISKFWKDVRMSFSGLITQFLQGKIQNIDTLLLRIKNNILTIIPEEFNYNIINSIQIPASLVSSDASRNSAGFLFFFPISLIFIRKKAKN